MKERFYHWADEAAWKIVQEKGEKEMYTCASGITPSGTVHAGNFREIISTELVTRALRDMGKKVRFIYSWDDYDVFRKVPSNMPRPEELEKYLRFPITLVPDTTGRDENYARHNEVDVETGLPAVGVLPEFIYQTRKYRACTYAGEIRKALLQKDRLRAILDKFRDDEHKIQGEWWPVSVFCAKCNRDTTEITGFDGNWNLSYKCASCGCEESVDLRQAPGVKLLWRVDWPMRWAWEGVDFEPAGKDHHSEGGSFDTARLVAKEVYGVAAPSTFRYDFIGFKGTPGKMSSSRGTGVVALSDLLRYYTPEIVRYLFVSQRPNTEFTISFDIDVIKIYEEYDRNERLALGLEKSKDEAAFKRSLRLWQLSQVSPQLPDLQLPDESRTVYQVPFRHLCNLLQIHDGNIEETIKRLPASGFPAPPEGSLPALKTRCQCAWRWIEEAAPEEFRFRLRDSRDQGPVTREQVRDTQDGGVPQQFHDSPAVTHTENPVPGPRSPVHSPPLALLRERVVSRIETFPDDKTCAEAIYAAAGEAGVEPKEMFKAAYQALIGKDQGPRLAGFLRAIDKARLLALLAPY